ncbi:MAG TPA: T9SS type A sorting domain-containing protein [Bacteroidales bacterium]|nr:T9SS type A sorting domain-containing protein [Bacteroidales bacterium]
MKHIIFIISVLIPLQAFCQETLPGGVKGASVWQIAGSTQSGISRFRSLVKDTSSPGFNVTGKTRTINNNQALYFSDGANSMNSTLNLGKLRSFSLFTVSQEADTTLEKIIVSVENDSVAEMVLTNRRMAALDLYRYSSYTEVMNLFPRLYSYTGNKSSDTGSVNRRLRLGREPASRHLPASVYSGIIPEIIVFNRVISPRERQQVESYLALKYGISLNQEFPASYLNSSGEVIWDSGKNAAYNSNIAGIGRDDLSGLNQLVSESTQTPGIMKISCPGELKNNTFITWGDNAKPLSFSEESGFRKLQRDWKISPFNSKGDPLCVETDIMALSEIKPLKEGEMFWLMADRSGTGKYPFGQTDFLPCGSSSTGRIVVFRPVIFDPDHSGADVFTIITAPSFFARSSIKQPTCQPLQMGEVETFILGGYPPFEFVLNGTTDNRIHMSSRENSREHVFKGVRQGAYMLTISDSKNNIFSEKLWVPNLTSWQPEIAETYTIPPGEAIALNASEGMPAQDFVYSWTAPDGSQVSGETITVSQPGIYLLSVTDAYNCNSTREVTITQSGSTGFRMVDLFPNPSDGLFTLRMMLESVMDVNVIITDVNGKMLKQILMREDRFYRYSDVINLPGTYFITLLSPQNDKITLKLIVR